MEISHIFCFHFYELIIFLKITLTFYIYLKIVIKFYNFMYRENK